MSNRILDYPEATEITSNDYILLDNEGSGAKCIKASALNINMDNYTIKEARGAIASFDDGEDLPLAFMGAYITAIQDLHGYDAPWVGGAGKNKLPLILDNIKANNTSGTWNGNTYVHPNGITFNIITNNSGAIEKIVATGTASGNAVLLLDSATFKPWTGTFIINGCIEGSGSTYFWDMQAETSGNVINYDGDTSFVPNQNYRPRIVITSGYQCPTNGITFKPMVRLASVQDATFAPYSNICPISGWDEVNVGVSGVNIWDEEWEKGVISITTGQNVSGNGIRSKNYSNCKGNTSYYFSVGQTADYIMWYDKDKNFINHTYADSSKVVTSPSNAYYFKIRIDSISTYSNNISINYPSTDTSYHAYNGATYTIDLDGTRYGGKVDLVSGVLTVDRKIVTFDGSSDENISEYSASSYRYRLWISEYKAISESVLDTKLICSKLKTYTKNDLASDSSILYGLSPSDASSAYVIVKVNGITNLADFKTWLSQNELQIVYPLATPLTIQLSKQQIKSLVGENNIFADTGDSVVDYRKLWVMPEM